MDEMSVERLLNRAAPGVAYPPTPPLRAAVLRELPASWQRPARPAAARFVATAVAGVVAIVIVAALALPGSRSAIGEFFGIEGSTIERLPTPDTDTTPTPLPSAEDIATVATPLTLGAATQFAGFEPALPDGQGAPDAVFGVDFATQYVVLQYADFDLWQGRLEGESVRKGLPEGTLLRETTVNGVPARWASEGMHIVTFIDRDGREVTGSQRTVARNTLIWRTGYAFYRIETALPLEDALEIAESLP